jgi:hypothetical protein
LSAGTWRSTALSQFLVPVALHAAADDLAFKASFEI